MEILIQLLLLIQPEELLNDIVGKKIAQIIKQMEKAPGALRRCGLQVVKPVRGRIPAARGEVKT